MTLKRGTKVIEISAIRKVGCGFLFAFYSRPKCGRMPIVRYSTSSRRVEYSSCFGEVSIATPTQLDSTSICRHVHSVNNCHLSMNVVTQLTQFVGHDVINKNKVNSRSQSNSRLHLSNFIRRLPETVPHRHRRSITASTSSSWDRHLYIFVARTARLHVAGSPRRHHHRRRNIAVSSSSPRRRRIFITSSSQHLRRRSKPRYMRDEYAQLFLSSTYVKSARNTFRSSGVSYTYTHYRG